MRLPDPFHLFLLFFAYFLNERGYLVDPQRVIYVVIVKYRKLDIEKMKISVCIPVFMCISHVFVCIIWYLHVCVWHVYVVCVCVSMCSCICGMREKYREVN